VAMKKPRRRTGRIRAAAGAVLAVFAVAMTAGVASAKKKEKAVLPDFVLKAETVLVVILPDAGEPMTDPFANRKAQEEVEKALMKWGRYRLAIDANTADLVIGVRKGTGRAANPTINGGPVDSRPGTIETTDNQIRVGVQQGRAPSTTQTGDASGTGGPSDRAQPGMELGAEDDTFKVFQGKVQYPVDTAPAWMFVAKDGLKAPGVAAVEQFRKAVEEAEKAAAQKKQQQQQGQKKNP
jgi:hypothetical protein